MLSCHIYSFSIGSIFLWFRDHHPQPSEIDISVHEISGRTIPVPEVLEGTGSGALGIGGFENLIHRLKSYMY